MVGSGDAEKVVLSRKSALRSALARLLVKKNVASAAELLSSEVSNPGILFIQVLWSTLLMKLKFCSYGLIFLRATVQDWRSSSGFACKFSLLCEMVLSVVLFLRLKLCFLSLIYLPDYPLSSSPAA